jgi:hypothetical protein
VEECSLDTRSVAGRLTRCGVSFISLEILEIGGGGDDGIIVTHLAMYLNFWVTALSLVKIVCVCVCVCVCGNDFIASQKVPILLFR